MTPQFLTKPVSVSLQHIHTAVGMFTYCFWVPINYSIRPHLHTTRAPSWPVRCMERSQASNQPGEMQRYASYSPPVHPKKHLQLISSALKATKFEDTLTPLGFIHILLLGFIHGHRGSLIFWVITSDGWGTMAPWTAGSTSTVGDLSDGRPWKWSPIKQVVLKCR